MRRLNFFPKRASTAARRLAFLTLLVAAACGSRTGLFTDDTFEALPEDAGTDARRDATIDSSFEDVPPPLDVQPPQDVNRTGCPDAATLLIYTITDSYELQSFDPDTGAFNLIGKITCPTTVPNDTPFSMAVDRTGIAYILFSQSFELFRVSTATAACIGTSFIPNQQGFSTFGMGFATNGSASTESLYIAGAGQNPGDSDALGRITIAGFTVATVGEFIPHIDESELTGTGDGRLFGFYRKGRASAPSFIGQIDTKTAQVIGEREFPTVDQGNGWAFAFWGGDFYMFHAPGPNQSNPTVVTRWRPSDDSVADIATTNLEIVGAGVSTCAPQN